MDSATLNPTSGANRYHSLDLIRGVAVAGILVMNIYAFANIYAYYVSPYALGEPSTANLVTWLLTHIFADQKFYTIFSMLFGAGIMLMAERAQEKGVSAAKLHYKRMFWLLIFGLVHAILIWYGDILVTYALAGLWVFLFARNTTAQTKIIIGSSLIIFILLIMTAVAFFATSMPDEEAADMVNMFTPSQDYINQETLPYTTSYAAQLSHRIDFFIINIPMMALFWGLFRIGGSMLIGMSLYQIGVLSAQRSCSFYIKLMLISFTLGFGLLAYDSYALLSTQFGLQAGMMSSMSINSLAAIFIALGYIAVLCLWVQSNKLTGLRRRLEAVGRMAFSNYIAQSLICTTLFYSHGFGLFGELERYQLMLIVGVIFIAQLLWSQWWLARFTFGPLEWLWRSLSYAKLQPFRRA